MGGKNKFLLFLPADPHKRAVRVSINPFTFAISVIAFSAILLLAINGTWNMVLYYQVSERSLLFENQNQLAKDQLQVMKGRVDTLNREFLRIKQKAGYIQNLLGVKPKVPGSAGTGQGGSEIDPNALFRGEPFSMKHHQSEHLHASAPTAFLSNQDINELDAGLEQIIGTIQIIQKRLDHTPSISPVDPSLCWISSPFRQIRLNWG